MKPKITIITPSYNQGQYIEQTITSILDQGYPNLEYIIIDGGSSDQTVDVIKKYEDKITHWVSEADNGQAHAINKGLALTTGDIVNWINSDDYLEPGALEKLAAAYIKHPQGEVFCGYTHCFWYPSGDTSHTYRMGLKKNATSTLLNIEMNQPGTFYKTNILKSLGVINESLRYVFDNELWMRYLCQYGQKNVMLLKDTLAHFRQHDNSKSFGEGFELFYREQLDILKALAAQCKLPVYLLKLINQDDSSSNYETEDWILEALDIEYFKAFYANKYLTTIANSGNKKYLKECIKWVIKKRTLSFDRKRLGAIKYLFNKTI